MCKRGRGAMTRVMVMTLCMLIPVIILTAKIWDGSAYGWGWVFFPLSFPLCMILAVVTLAVADGAYYLVQERQCRED